MIGKTFPFFIKDSKSFIQKLEMLRQLGIKKHSHILATADVKSMYPNINIDFGLSAFKKYLIKCSQFSYEMIQFLCELAELVLTTNIVQFEGEFFLQIKGTVMGTNFAPKYAYMVYWAIEKQVFQNVQLNMRFKNLSMQKQQGLGILKYYGRYIDDLFMVLKVKKDSLTQWKASKIKEEFNKANQLLLDEVIVRDQVLYLDALVLLVKETD
jgi:hypothetical protein